MTRVIISQILNQEGTETYSSDPIQKDLPLTKKQNIHEKRFDTIDMNPPISTKS